MGRTTDVQSEIDGAKALVASGQNLGARLRMAIIAARVRSGMGEPRKPSAFFK
jgi:hypothetical protein